MLPLPACLGNGWIRLYLYRADVTPSYFQPGCHGNHKASAPVRSSIYNLLTPPSPQPHPKETGANGEQSANIYNTLHFPRRPVRGGAWCSGTVNPFWKKREGRQERGAFPTNRKRGWHLGVIPGSSSHLVRGAGWDPLPSDRKHCLVTPSPGASSVRCHWAPADQPCSVSPRAEEDTAVITRMSPGPAAQKPHRELDRPPGLGP